MEFKTTKNTISIGTQIHEPKIFEAKQYLKKEFGNKYDIDVHFNFLIMAMPEHKLKHVEEALDHYFSHKIPLSLNLGTLHFEPKNKFFSIPILGDGVMNFHKELIQILNPIRDSYIREKDLIRINEGKTDEEEKENIINYGYLRVLNKFIPHITIGNIQNDSEVNIDEIKKHLDMLLGNVYNTTINIDRVYATFIEDANIQSDYKWLWEKTYTLQ